MSSNRDQFELVEFEHFEAAPGTTLLRLAARRPDHDDGGALGLIVADGVSEHRFDQLPSLPGPPGLLRAAFTVGSREVAHGNSFSLIFPDGSTIKLPAPTRREATGQSGLAPVTATEPPEATPEPTLPARNTHELISRLSETENRAEARRLAIIELERRLQSERERRMAAEAQATHAQTRLEVELGDTTAEQERLRSAVEAAQARADASRRELVELEEEAESLRSQVAGLEQALLERRENDPGEALVRRQAEIEALRAELSDRDQRLQALFARTTEQQACTDAALETLRLTREAAVTGGVDVRH